MYKFSGLLLVFALVGLLLGMPIAPVFADGEVILTKVASSDNATLGDNITYTYTIINNTSDNLTGLTLVKEADKSVAALGDVITYTYNVSNNGVVEIKDISLTDDPLGNIALLSDNSTVTRLGPGESIIAKATYTVVFDDLRAGSIKNTATVTGTDPNGNAITANSGEVEVSTNVFLSLLTKAWILKASGVPGKGIDKAPGLQKPFNPNSQASEHAGKKDIKGNVQTDNSSEMKGSGEQEQEQEQEMNSSGEQEQEMNGSDEQDDGQEMNSNNRQDGKQEMNKNKEKGKGNGHGNNK